MKYRYRWVGAAWLAVLASPALAGDQPLYAPAPEWVKPAALPDDKQPSGAGGLMLLDFQHRIDGPTVWQYSDTIRRLDSPESLTQSNIITLPWSPDKGDLIIHQLSILRDGQTIDVLADGQKFTVLRREEQLEKSELSGILSATLAVEGLLVGDRLRLRASVTRKDAALGGRSQIVQWLPAAPVRIPSAGYSLAWRKDQPVQWKSLAGKLDLKPVRDGDFMRIEVAAPLAKLAEMPDDAPGRYRLLPMIEASTFASWADVSKVMAPLYATQGTVAPDGPIAAEIAAIVQATSDPMERAARALQLVQDKIRYLAVGMDGGNYVPQSPQKTWDARYGDCKAKTLLLLAMLHAMGIEAEPVLAGVRLGELVPERIPSAAAFDHVLVRATIGSQSLWLDGTALGTRLADMRDTPRLGHVLPLRADGSDLVAVDLRAPGRPTIDLEMTADESTSIDLPSVIELKMVVRGELASLLTLMTAQMPERELRDGVQSVLEEFVGEAQFEQLEAVPDPDSGTVTIRGRGVFNTGWKMQDRRMERWLSRVPDLIDFKPDRARPAWAAIPVATAGPQRSRYRMSIRLPDGGRGYTIEGDSSVDVSIGGTAIRRSLTMANGEVVVEEDLTSLGSEVAASDVPRERDRMATLLARSPRLVAPADARRRWSLAGAPSDSQINTIRTIYDKEVQKADEENTTALTSSLSLYRGIGDFKGAASVLDRQIALMPSAEAYSDRASVRAELGDLKGALADARAARSLDPSDIGYVGQVAGLMAELGDLEVALALVDERIALGGKTLTDLQVIRADLLGIFGDAAQALIELDTVMATKPGDPSLLNMRCWIKGTRMVQTESALKDCTGALELSDSTAGILDSRALVWLRMGRLEEALADLDAALLQAPSLAESRYLRSIVYRKLGREADAATDLAVARQLSPSLERQYARYGLKP